MSPELNTNSAELTSIPDVQFPYFKYANQTKDEQMAPPAILSKTKTLDPAGVVRLCTVLYQQQRAPDAKLDAHLLALNLTPSHELFIQVANRFALPSYRPLLRFHLHLARRHPHFSHSAASLNKIVASAAAARNFPLLLSLLNAPHHPITPRTVQMAASALAAAGEVSAAAAAVLRLPSALSRVVAHLSARKLAPVAKKIVARVQPTISPNNETYHHLLVGFCRAGDLASATKLWNQIVTQNNPLLPESYQEMVTVLLKSNQYQESMRLFKLISGIRPYKVLIRWLCSKGRISDAFMVFGEMLKRGVEVDTQTVGALVYGLVVRRRVREGHRVVALADEPDIELYHGMIKGLLRLKRAGEATGFFREMLERGCEPTMHTYIMLLQGHMGKRGRKGREYPLVNFESVFVGGLVKVGKMLEATKYVERMMWGGRVEVPRFDYNKFLHCFSDEEGVAMFEGVGRRMKEVGLVDLGDIFLCYGERMATRDRRRKAMSGC